MKATASRSPTVSTEADATRRGPDRWPSRLTRRAASANDATVTQSASPTPKAAMRSPATGAPSRYPTCSADVNSAFARSRWIPTAVGCDGHQALPRRRAGRVGEGAERRPAATTCQTSRASSASSTGSGATARPLRRSAGRAGPSRAERVDDATGRESADGGAQRAGEDSEPRQGSAARGRQHQPGDRHGHDHVAAQGHGVAEHQAGERPPVRHDRGAGDDFGHDVNDRRAETLAVQHQDSELNLHHDRVSGRSIIPY